MTATRTWRRSDAERELRREQLRALLGVDLREELRRRSLPMRRAARVLGVTSKSVARWCRGDCVPATGVLLRLRGLLDGGVKKSEVMA